MEKKIISKIHKHYIAINLCNIVVLITFVAPLIDNLVYKVIICFLLFSILAFGPLLLPRDDG